MSGNQYKKSRHKFRKIGVMFFLALINLSKEEHLCGIGEDGKKTFYDGEAFYRPCSDCKLDKPNFWTFSCKECCENIVLVNQPEKTKGVGKISSAALSSSIIAVVLVGIAVLAFFGWKLRQMQHPRPVRHHHNQLRVVGDQNDVHMNEIQVDEDYPLIENDQHIMRPTVRDMGTQFAFDLDGIQPEPTTEAIEAIDVNPTYELVYIRSKIPVYP